MNEYVKIQQLSDHQKHNQMVLVSKKVLAIIVLITQRPQFSANHRILAQAVEFANFHGILQNSVLAGDKK